MKHALVIFSFIALVGCASPVSTMNIANPDQTPEICSGIEQWAIAASKYDDLLTDECSGSPGIAVEAAVHCKNIAVESWEELSSMSYPVIVSATHDMLRRAVALQILSSRMYIENPEDFAYHQFFVDNIEKRKEFRERRDLVLALCGYQQAEILADIEWSHTVEDYNLRMSLATDRDEFKRLQGELFDLQDERRARPPEERLHAVQIIQSIVGNEVTVNYLSTHENQELYTVCQTLFVIDRTKDRLLSINEIGRDPESYASPRELDFTPIYAHDELELMAQEFIHMYAPYINLALFTLEDQIKTYEEGQYHWFRWSLPDTTGQFVVIAYTPAAEIAVYENNIPDSYLLTEEETN
jgi:hypothetical protein